ncbi:hypothetical protein [Lysinibacillus sp. FSL K6-0102]|uniref:hypothetical protein n=1 Tax=Lysinibacillus sp. FSL K6-0102 TaxID=2975290 RepID=UPI0030F6169D
MVMTEALLDVEILHTSSLPLNLEYTISRKPFVSTVKSLFDEDNLIVIIEGMEFTGKTYFLKEFYELNLDSSVAYFATQERWTSNIESIFIDLIQQMSNFCSTKLKYNLRNINYLDLNFEKSKHLFREMYKDLISTVSKTRKPFYFIFDGIEKMEKESREMLLQLIPKGDPRGIYILMSRRSESDFSLEGKFKNIPLSNFSQPEVSDLLTKYGITDYDTVQKIYDKSMGLAGYIGEIVKGIEKGKYTPEFLTEHLPENIQLLLERNWKCIDSTLLKEIIKVIVFSPEKMDIKDMSQVLNVSQDELKPLIKDSDLIKIDQERQLFLESIYVNFLYDFLSEEKIETEQKLIEYYEIQSEVKRFDYLPKLYANKGNYEKIKALINFNNLDLLLKESQITSQVFENINLLRNMSYDYKDWGKMTSSMILEAIFKQTSASLPSLDREVSSLLALKKYNEALKLVSLCSLDEDRLILLSKISRKMKEDGVELSEKIIKEISYYVNGCRINMDFGIAHAEKFIIIGSNLYAIDVKLTLDLIQNSVKEIEGKQIKKYLIDYLLINIFINLRENEDDKTNLHQFVSYFENEDLKPLISTYAHSSLEYEGLISTIDKVTNPNIKSFIILNWLEINNENSYFLDVCTKYIDLISSELEYSITLKDLLKLIDCIEKRTNENEAQKLEYILTSVNNIYQLVQPSAFVERIQVELGLMRIMVKNNHYKADDQFLDLRIKVDEIKDLDIKCFSNVFLLNTLCKEGFEDLKSVWYTEIKNMLNKDINYLLLHSSNQLGDVGDILYNFALVEHTTALSMAYKINTEKSRVSAFVKIFQAMIEKSIFKIDDFIVVLKTIIDKGYKDHLIISLMKHLATNQPKDVSSEDINKYFSYSKGIDTIQGKLIALSYLLDLDNINVETGDQVKELLILLLKGISDVTTRENAGTYLIQRLSKRSNEVAEDIFDIIFSNNVLNYKENRLESFYKELIIILNKSLENVLKGINSSSVEISEKMYITNICSFIDNVASIAEKAYLYCDLSLRCLAFDRRDLIIHVVDKYKKIVMNDRLDTDTLKNILLRTGALLCTESILEYKEVLTKIKSSSQRNAILTSNIHQLIIGRPYHDDVEIKNSASLINDNTLKLVLELLDLIDYDANLYQCIDTLTDAVIRSYKELSKKYVNQAAVMYMIDEIKRISSKLPCEDVGIKHEGYILAIESSLLKLKRLNLKPALMNKKKLMTYEELKEKANKITNISDKIFVLTRISAHMGEHEKDFSKKVLELADKSLTETVSSVDYISHSNTIASRFYQIGNERAALYVINKAIEKIRFLNDEEDSEKDLEEFIDLCYEINQDQAKSYVDSIKSKKLNYEYKQKFKAKKYHYEPKKILDEEINQSDVLQNFFKYSLKSIYADKGSIQSEEIIGEYLYQISTANPELLLYGLTWYVENVRLGSNISASRLDVLFNDIIMSLSLIQKLNAFLFNVNQSKIEFDEKYSFSKTYDLYFNVGEGDRALEFIVKWINENVSNTLFIYDAYFEPKNLKMFKYLVNNITTTVLTSCKESEYIQKCEKVYNNQWKDISDQSAPFITIMTFVTKNGSTPIHDRYILGEKEGLNIGTSLNGVDSKDFGINIIDEEKVESIRNKFINPLIYTPKNEHLGLPMRREIFMVR